MVVIDAHTNNYWEPLCNAYQIILPATIVENELFYFESEKGKKRLTVDSWLKEGKVERIDAELKDYDALQRRFIPDFMSTIHAGEREALAILISPSHQKLHFTTADRAAIKALGLLGLGSRGISVEELLNDIGHKQKQIQRHMSKEWFQKALSEGFQERHMWLR